MIIIEYNRFLRFSARVWLLALVTLCSPLLLWSCAHKDAVDVNALDDATIQDYLKRHSYTAADYQRTASGLYLVTLKAGAGTPVTTGKQVSVKYTGKFVSAATENTVFDTSDNTKDKSFSFVAGDASLIKGWTEGVLLMRQGDRKLLLIPSYLAYGPSGKGPIAPDTPILFDMEILTISP